MTERNPVIRPPFLKKGDWVAVITPASQITKPMARDFADGIRVLTRLGLRVTYDEGIFEKYRYRT